MTLPKTVINVINRPADLGVTRNAQRVFLGVSKSAAQALRRASSFSASETELTFLQTVQSPVRLELKHAPRPDSTGTSAPESSLFRILNNLDISLVSDVKRKRSILPD